MFSLPSALIIHYQNKGDETDNKTDGLLSVDVNEQPSPLTDDSDHLETFVIPNNSQEVEVSNTQNMKFEAERLKTFDGKWPLDFISAEKLALLGCYYIGPFDKVRCNFCKIEIGLWDEGDEEVIEHQRWSPNCPLLNREECENVPISTTKLEDILPHFVSFDVCGINTTVEFRSSSFGDSDNSSSSTVEPSLTQSLYTNSSGSATRTLGSTNADAPMYAIEAKRLESFKTWPRSMKQSATELSDAGFYYTGQGDLVRCFSCGGGVKDWMECDIPWEQHALYFGTCQYVKLVKGEKYVSDIIAKFKDTNTEERSENGTSASQRTSESDDELNNFASPSCSTPEGDEKGGPLTEGKQCKICYTNPYDTAFFPCGHVVACAKCAASVNKCPICRKPLEHVIRLYFS